MAGTNEDIKQLHNGFYVERDADNRWHLARCRWLVEVPSGNPEPDSIEDTVKVIECNARITWFSPSGSSFACEAGHHHVAYTEGGADVEYQREQAERGEGVRS